MLIKVEHKLTANDIDLLLKRLTATSTNRISTTVNSNNVNYTIFYSYYNNLVTVNIYPNNNDWIKYISSFEGSLDHFKIRLLTSSTFDLVMSDKQHKVVSLSTDIWTKEQSTKRILEHNQVASENMKVTDTEVAIIEAARNKLTN
mgnify:FL=1